MKMLLNFVVIVAVFSLGEAYSKYGRTCKDIGCTANQICVMQEDPCTPYSKPNQCGKYPTCKKVSNAAATCASYVCPPTMTCRMDRGVPKCFGKSAGKTINNRSGHASASIYPSNYPQNPSYSQYPNYPQQPKPAVYSNYPSGAGYGQTTPRPNIYQPGQRVSGGGYQGSVIGSGYPGQGGYPRQGSRYPSQGGSYSHQTYQHGPYSTQWNNGYSGQSYPKQSVGQGGYPSSGQYRYDQRSGQDDYNIPLNKLSSFLKSTFNIEV